MSAAIVVENLGKSYRVNHEKLRGYRTLRESVTNLAAAPLRRLRNGGQDSRTEEFWALNDVNFEVQPGEVVGIIGRNGAGKSTLLKILSRITKPTRGRVTLNGRVGSLLEVGTGFHPELTGRENIYMNGSILGMSRREITAKFDEIVAFAEIEKFLDTPVKRYSSGMYVRLAFTVAAHLEPEILIVDEVLAVGDASFQKRCLDRMNKLAKSGRTVLLVSHNMQVIPQLCRQAFLLDAGSVILDGPANEIAAYYIKSQIGHCNIERITSDRKGDGRARFTRMQIVDIEGKPVYSHTSGDDIAVRMKIEASNDVSDVAIAVVLQNMSGLRLITSWTSEANFKVDLRKGVQFVDCHFHSVRLRPGHEFTISLWMATNEIIDYVENVQTVPVIASELDIAFSTNSDQGILLCNHSWCYSCEN